MNTKVITYLYPIIFLFVALIVLLLSPLAPFAKGGPEIDSSCFIYCGEQILNGKLIYKDVIDHKGPILYLIEVIGLKIFNGNTVGIWLLEVLSLTATGSILFITLRLYFDRFISFLSVITGMIGLIPLFSGGNLVEEWALPYISIALFIFIKYLKNNKPLSLIELGLLSLSFVITFFLRANLVSVWAGFGVVILSRLILQKRYEELIKYFTTVTISISLFTIPIILYFSSKGILNDAYYWVFNFNTMEYSSFSAEHFIKFIIFFLRSSGFGLLLPILICIMFFTNNKSTFFYGFTLSIVISIFSCGIGHLEDLKCYMIFIPLMIFGYAYLFNLVEKIGRDLVPVRKVIIGIAIICSMESFVVWSVRGYLNFSNNNPTSLLAKDIANSVNKYTKPNDKILVVGYWCRIYLDSDRECAIKYPYLIPSSIAKKSYYDETRASLPKMIIMGDKIYGSTFIDLSPLLRERYKLLETDVKGIEFWKLNEI